MGQVNVLVGKIGNQIVVEPEWVKLSMSNKDEIVWICNAANFEVDFGSPGNCPFPGWSVGKNVCPPDVRWIITCASYVSPKWRSARSTLSAGFTGSTTR